MSVMCSHSLRVVTGQEGRWVPASATTGVEAADISSVASWTNSKIESTTTVRKRRPRALKASLPPNSS